MDFVRDNPGEPVPEETFTHSHLSWSSIVPYLLHPSTMIHGIFPVQSTCLYPCFLVYLLAWHPPLHTPYISSPNHCLLFATHVHTITICFIVVPRLCHLILVCLSTLCLEFCPVVSCHTSIWPFSFLPREVPPHFRFLQARYHFHATYYIARNCCTISLSLSMIHPYW